MVAEPFASTCLARSAALLSQAAAISATRILGSKLGVASWLTVMMLCSITPGVLGVWSRNGSGGSVCCDLHNGVHVSKDSHRDRGPGGIFRRCSFEVCGGSRSTRPLRCGIGCGTGCGGWLSETMECILPVRFLGCGETVRSLVFGVVSPDCCLTVGTRHMGGIASCFECSTSANLLCPNWLMLGATKLGAERTSGDFGTDGKLLCPFGEDTLGSRMTSGVFG
mmetsp:Transcript_147566/g.274975  ORF Transcript_147566/g.274975 Transcript_147566/m.274975 type:complete len:223 (-) Transcript_147566:262-930(-)